MQLMSVYPELNFAEITPEIVGESHVAECYAFAVCAGEQAHLSIFMSTSIPHTPSAGALPLAHALVDEISAKRRVHAEEAQKRIESANDCRRYGRVLYRSGLSSAYTRSPRRSGTTE
jgi:hypothetical protein